ncbi:MAG: hypothetical protein U9N35_06820 [Euryarchaeota archaeon]|nr:hypothetical protein [Euryarchaeota archaeon]
MRHSVKIGVCFGLTSAVITTLGLMVGLESGTHLKSVVIGGILIIAIADALSDAMGIHISEESENKHTPREIWESTLATFLSKFVFALTFVVPLLFFQLSTAILVDIGWGFFLLSLFSFYIAKEQKKACWGVILEHLVLAAVVILLTHYIGRWISTMLG